MVLLKNTVSVCPECFVDIPAQVYDFNGQAKMLKRCPTHGQFESLVERDVEFYKLIQKYNSTMFYEGLVIDITYKCNLRCKWCFQHLKNEEVSTQRILELAQQMPYGHKIILSGGEPTLRKDLADIVRTLDRMGYNVNAITNGYAIDWSLPCEWTLSHHPESEDLFSLRIKEARCNGNKFASIIYTDCTIDNFYHHVLEAKAISSLCSVFRMHAASPVGGNLADDVATIFVSDMVHKLEAHGHELDMHPGKTIFLPLTVDDVPFMLISWSTAHNVDVMENHCEPWYHGRGNAIDNLVTRIIRDN